MAKQPTKLPLDDIIKAVINQVRKATGKPYSIQFRDEVTGKVAKDIGKAKVTYGPPPSVKSRMTADQKVTSKKRDENIRANINRAEGAPRIGSNSKKRRPIGF